MRAVPYTQTETQSRLFDANRAQGAMTLEVNANGGPTRRKDVFEQGSLRVRFPTPTNPVTCEAVLMNNAGGIGSGDRFDISMHAHKDSRLVATTAAAERIYRSHGPEAQLNVKLSAEAGSEIVWAPQETILFDKARAVRKIDINLHADAKLTLCEMVVFGRTAMGEVMRSGRFVDLWRLKRDGALTFADNVRLDGEIAEALRGRATGHGAVAIGTVLIAPGDESLVEKIRSEVTLTSGAGVSAWNGHLIARFCSHDAARMRTDIIAMLKVAGVALPRIWLN